MASFGTGIRHGFTNYVNFTGRSSRSEFWWWILFYVLVSIVTSILDNTIGRSLADDPALYQSGSFRAVQPLAQLALLLPTLALTIRRFRDAGHLWPWVLVYYAGLPIVLVGALGAIGSGLSGSQALLGGALAVILLGGLVVLAGLVITIVFACMPSVEDPRFINRARTYEIAPTGYPSYTNQNWPPQV